MTSIFHYTSGTSLLGIMSNSEFWATDINFLNDHKEHVIGYEASLAYIEELKSKEDDPEFGFWLKELYQQLITHLKSNVISRQTYVVSFSKNPDSIAHWFSYCEKNQGYCLEFEEEGFLNKDDSVNLSRFSTIFEDVNYADAKMFRNKLGEVVSKQSILSIILDSQRAADLIRVDVRAQNNPIADKYLEAVSNRLMNELFSRIIVSSCSYKDRGFSHETERRLVLLQKDINIRFAGETLGIKFRERNGAIFPYAPVPFNRSSIKRIIIGPCADYNFKKSGLLKLLKHYNLECDVEPSSSSLRFN